MKTARPKLRNSVPTANLRTVLEIASEKGATAEAMLQGTGLTPAMLQDTELRVAARDAARIVHNAYVLTRNPGLGLEFGLRTRPTAHGHLGYAAMACGTLREALEVVVRYMHLRQQDVALKLTVQDDQVVLEITDAHEMGAARRFIHEAMLIGLWHIAGFLLGEERAQCELWFDWPQPKYFAAYRRRLPVVHFDRPSTQLRMHARYLNRRLVMAEPEAVKKAVAECEREMVLLGAPGNLKQRVCAELHAGDAGYPNLQQVAARLFMSQRTLKRKLEQLGSRFQSLLDEARYRDASRMLENPDIEVQQIAAALGYTDPPSFTRAFRRWSGSTPSQARKSM